METMMIGLKGAGDYFMGGEGAMRLEEAVHNAGKNLYGRKGARIDGPLWRSDLDFPYVIITVDDPWSEFAQTLRGNVGRHLRGISRYLLEHYPELKKYRYGTRLFTYVTGIESERTEREMMSEEKKYTLEELKEIWAAFEKEWHMGPGYHLCASDVRHFLDFLETWEKRKKAQSAHKTLRSLWEV